jgi:cyclopropane fatty-acyl-phospholipid synthase-like methyltransferase
MALRRSFLLATLALLGAAAALPALAQHGAQTHHRRFDDAEKWSKIFDDPARDQWQKPAEVIAALKLAPDALVADIGSGTGYFAVRLARAVPNGKVFGADLEPDMVKFLNERAAKEKLPNLASHLAAEDDPKLPAPVDLVLIVDTYHHIAARAKYFRELRAALKPGGRVAIIDFRLDSPTGPPVRQRVAAKVVAEEMALAGYREAERHELLPNQYFLVFAPR